MESDESKEIPETESDENKASWGHDMNILREMGVFIPSPSAD